MNIRDVLVLHNKPALLQEELGVFLVLIYEAIIAPILFDVNVDVMLHFIFSLQLIIMEALYTITLSNPEYITLVEDIIRMVIIQTTIQFLYYINNAESAFFSVDFLLLVVYVVLGVCVYWLVFKKLVHFK